MTLEEAKERAKQYVRAKVLKCPKCGDYVVISYFDVSGVMMLSWRNLRGEC